MVVRSSGERQETVGATGELVVDDGRQALPFGLLDEDVDVVVPRDEPAVAHGSDDAAPVEVPLDVVLAADLVELEEEFEQLGMQELQLLLGSSRVQFRQRHARA